MEWYPECCCLDLWLKRLLEIICFLPLLWNAPEEWGNAYIFTIGLHFVQYWCNIGSESMHALSIFLFFLPVLISSDDCITVTDKTAIDSFIFKNLTMPEGTKKTNFELKGAVWLVWSWSSTYPFKKCLNIDEEYF